MLHLTYYSINGHRVVAFVFVLNRFAKITSPSLRADRALLFCNIIFINNKVNYYSNKLIVIYANRLTDRLRSVSFFVCNGLSSNSAKFHTSITVTYSIKRSTHTELLILHSKNVLYAISPFFVFEKSKKHLLFIKLRFV